MVLTYFFCRPPPTCPPCLACRPQTRQGKCLLWGQTCSVWFHWGPPVAETTKGQWWGIKGPRGAAPSSAFSPSSHTFLIFPHTVIDDWIPPLPSVRVGLIDDITHHRNNRDFLCVYCWHDFCASRAAMVWSSVMISRLGAAVSRLRSQARTRPCPAEMWRQQIAQRWTKSVDWRQTDSLSHLSLLLPPDSTFIHLCRFCASGRICGLITRPISFNLLKKWLNSPVSFILFV